VAIQLYSFTASILKGGAALQQTVLADAQQSLLPISLALLHGVPQHTVFVSRSTHIRHVQGHCLWGLHQIFCGADNVEHKTVGAASARTVCAGVIFCGNEVGTPYYLFTFTIS